MRDLSAHLAEECPQEPRLVYLEKWQKDQNGTLGRLEKKMDRLMWAIVTSMAVIVMALVSTLLTVVCS